MSAHHRHLVWMIAAVAALALVFVGKLYGTVLAITLLAAVAVVLHRSTPYHAELGALRTSLRLSCDDIRTVLEEYETFATSGDASALADRTLHRPQLLDGDSDDPDIARFHFAAHAARRFLHRLPARADDPDLTPRQLNALITVADERARDLRERWIAARAAAKRLGP